MEIAVEISLYPLDAQYLPPIQDFIDRVAARPGLRVMTNNLSTQVYGDHDRIFEMLREETRASFERGGKAVFVAKFVGPYTLPDG